jgi:hypothetical protein
MQLSVIVCTHNRKQMLHKHRLSYNALAVLKYWRRQPVF